VRRFFARFKKCSRFQRSNLLDSTLPSDRRLPACNERESANIFLAEARTRVAAKHSSRDYPARSAGSVCLAVFPRVPLRFTRGTNIPLLPNSGSLAGFCNDRSKNPVATAPGSDPANAAVGRRQRTTNNEPRTSRPPSAFRRYHERELRRDGHFPDMARFSRNYAVFQKLRSFLETTSFARNYTVFSKIRGFPCAE
jgi:hypothetical protein